MRCKIFLFLLLYLFVGDFLIHGQDTIRLMHYNLLYYGHNTTFCDNNNNHIEDKDQYLKTIVGHVNPDLLTVNEMGDDIANANRILANVLNVDGVTHFQRVPYISNNGSSNIVNTLFYNASKFSYFSQDVIEEDIDNNALVRVIDVYTLYSRNISASGDTVFLTLFVCHLKAGSDISDVNQRSRETAAIMSYLENLNKPGNYLICGDLNAKSSTDPSFENLINHPNVLYRFNDPINRLGEWWMNPDFADIHTQSTHNTTDCHVGGGMDDRFDFILANDYVLNATAGVKYLPGSYTTVGQDGGSFNDDLDTINNTAVPQSVAAALYKMSDHLPVSMDMVFDATVMVDQYGKQQTDFYFVNPVDDNLLLDLKGNISSPVWIEIRSLTGQLVFREQVLPSGPGSRVYQNITGLRSGCYLLSITDGKALPVVKKMIKL